MPSITLSADEFKKLPESAQAAILDALGWCVGEKEDAPEEVPVESPPPEPVVAPPSPPQRQPIIVGTRSQKFQNLLKPLRIGDILILPNQHNYNNEELVVTLHNNYTCLYHARTNRVFYSETACLKPFLRSSTPKVGGVYFTVKTGAYAGKALSAIVATP
jgi:hypothetical protein